MYTYMHTYMSKILRTDSAMIYPKIKQILSTQQQKKIDNGYFIRDNYYY